VALQRWNLVYDESKARCAVPRGCGAFGVCSDAATACACARGFTPRDPVSWSLCDTTGGCVRNTELQCGNNGSAAASAVGSEMKADRFFRMDVMRLPDDGEGPIRRTREGGSEWEPIKILLEGDGNSNKMNTASNTRLRLTTQVGQAHVATGVPLDLGTNTQPSDPRNAAENQTSSLQTHTGQTG
jgi:hypothetical protein